VTSPRLVASYKLTLGASFLSAVANAVFGLLVAWVLARYSFPGKRIVDAIVDIPFALPTAVAGLSLTALYAPNGWFGRYLNAIGIQVAYTPVGGEILFIEASRYAGKGGILLRSDLNLDGVSVVMNQIVLVKNRLELLPPSFFVKSP